MRETLLHNSLFLSCPLPSRTWIAGGEDTLGGEAILGQEVEN